MMPGDNSELQTTITRRVEINSANTMIKKDFISETKGRQKTKMPRRFGVYCPNVAAGAITEPEYKQTTKRKLPRRSAIVVAPQNLSEIYDGGEVIDHQDHQSVIAWADLPSCETTETSRVQKSDFSETIPSTIESDKNQLPRNGMKEKRQYVTPSPSDVIMGLSADDYGNRIGFKAYVKALCAAQYEEPETTFERSLIAWTILDSVKQIGGRILKESTRRKGMYYEKDDHYAIKKIEELLNQSIVYRDASSMRIQ